MTIDSELEERFWEKVRKSSGCWEWTASKINGYGRIGLTRARRQMFAHRLSYELHYGPVPDGLFVLHKCDNPGCVRPDHLFLGTLTDNNRDRAQKGRNLSVKGENHGRAKITNRDVVQMRQLYKNGKTPAELAKKYGISQSNVSRIVRGRAWKHIEP